MSSPRRIRLMLVDDHSLVRMGLAAVLRPERDLEIVAEADDGEEMLALYEAAQPDVTLLDIRMPGIGGLETLRRVCSRWPGAKVIMLTTSDLEEDVYQALKAGAVSYLLKTAKRPELLAAIRAAQAGQRTVAPSLELRIAARDQREQLSQRELEVLNLMRLGYCNREIAVALGFSEHTAKAHVKHVVTKLDAADRTEAVSRAFELGLLSVEG